MHYAADKCKRWCFLARSVFGFLIIREMLYVRFISLSVRSSFKRTLFKLVLMHNWLHWVETDNEFKM